MFEDAKGGNAPNPFDPASLRLDPSYAETIGVRKQLITVPVRKPTKHEFVRVHHDPGFSLSTAIIEVKEDREFYLLSPEIRNALPNEFAPFTLFTTINRQGVLSLWPARLPGPDGKDMEWYRSAREAAEKAKTNWVRVTSNMSLGAYELLVADSDLGEPDWPPEAFPEILRVAFRDHYVDSLDHSLIKRLFGRA